MDLDNILDSTLDDLADMPSIVPFPNGVHKVKLTFKIDDKKVAVQMGLEYIEVLELADPTSTAPAPGDKNSIYFGLKKKDGTSNDYAQGALKEIVKVLSAAFPGTTRETLTAAEGVEVIASTKVRLGKGEYEGKDNIEVVKMEIA
jgi:hypothetical protein